MPKKPRRRFTDAEVQLLQECAAIRLPVEQIANRLNTSVTELRYAQKRDERMRRAVDIGRAEASFSVRATLFQLATGIRNKDGTYKVKPDVNALKFWLMTQEGFKYEKNPVTQIAVTGPNGELQGSQGPQIVVTIPSNNREVQDDESDDA